MRLRRSSGQVLGVLLIALPLGGCLNLYDAYVTGEVCNPEAAREEGERDARAGRPLDETYAERCGVAEASLNQMYRSAYDGVPAGDRVPRSWLDRLLGRREPAAYSETARAPAD